MDMIDLRILEMLTHDFETPLQEIGRNCGIGSSSAISKRVKKLKDRGIILRSEAVLNYDELGYEFVTVTFIKARYGEDYTTKLAEKLLKIKGVVSILEILGEIDFVVIAINKSQNEYKKTMNYLMSLEEVERSDTRVVINKYRLFEPDKVKLLPSPGDDDSSIFA